MSPKYFDSTLARRAFETMTDHELADVVLGRRNDDWHPKAVELARQIATKRSVDVEHFRDLPMAANRNIPPNKAVPRGVRPGSAESSDPRVRVVDFDMPFGSMVGFMIKWALAAIPAVMILGLIWFALQAILGSLGLFAAS